MGRSQDLVATGWEMIREVAKKVAGAAKESIEALIGELVEKLMLSDLRMLMP